MSTLRTLARGIAKNRMKGQGWTRICSSRNFKGEKSKSKFARHWREFVNEGGKKS